MPPTARNPYPPGGDFRSPGPDSGPPSASAGSAGPDSGPQGVAFDPPAGSDSVPPPRPVPPGTGRRPGGGGTSLPAVPCGRRASDRHRGAGLRPRRCDGPALAARGPSRCLRFTPPTVGTAHLLGLPVDGEALLRQSVSGSPAVPHLLRMGRKRPARVTSVSLLFVLLLSLGSERL